MKKFGKNGILINRDILATTINPNSFIVVKEGDKLEEYYSVGMSGYIAEENTAISDNIRYYSNNYWALNEAGQIVPSVSINDKHLFSLEYGENKDVLILKSNKKLFFGEKFDDAGRITLEFRKDDWERVIEGQVLPPFDLFFVDDYIDLNQPVDIKENKDAIDKNVNFINVKTVYNFISKEYEEYISENRLNELDLPSYLNVIKSKVRRRTTRDENVNIYLGASMPDNYGEALHHATEENETVKEYFNLYPKILKKINSTLSFATPQSEQFFDEEISALRNTNYVPFPFYNEITFSNLSKNSKLKSILFEDPSHFLDMQIVLETTNENGNNILLEDTTYVINQNGLNKYVTKRLNIAAWLQERVSGVRPPMLYEIPEPYGIVKYYYLLKYFKENLKIYKKDFLDYVKKPCFSEVIFYTLRKYNSRTGALVQEYRIYPDEGDDIKFIDTQIKYGTEYEYKLFANIFHVGNRYSYSQYYFANNEEEKKRDIKDGIYKIKVNNYASYYLNEVELSSFKTSAYQPPATKPKIKIEKNLDKIEINLMDSDLESYEKYEFVENSDFGNIDPIRESQDNVDKNMVYCRDIDNKSKVLQIYRTMNKPTNYLSFQGKLYKTLNVENKRNFLETIIPNIKYYYLFRYLNEHSVPSNVSEVFEVEMKDEEGYLYLNVNKIDLNKTAEKTPYKNFKRYLLIRPSVVQTHPENTMLKNINDAKLGPDANSVWNKDFVVRIRSKKTNRVLEFNLKSIINRKKD